jgi:hypothetical protein
MREVVRRVLQERGASRMVGYAIGLAAVLVVALWRWAN